MLKNQSLSTPTRATFALCAMQIFASVGLFQGLISNARRTFEQKKSYLRPTTLKCDGVVKRSVKKVVLSKGQLNLWAKYIYIEYMQIKEKNKLKKTFFFSELHQFEVGIPISSL